MNSGRVTRNDLERDVDNMRLMRPVRYLRIPRRRREEEAWDDYDNEIVTAIALTNAMLDRQEVAFTRAQEMRGVMWRRMEVVMRRFESMRGIADEPVACEEVEVD